MISELLISQRPSPGACLDDLLATRFLPRSWASRLWSAQELPSPLQNCALHLAADFEWRAYGEDERILFAVARAHGAPQPDCGVAIDVYFLDETASVYSAGVWEYDLHHGWWLDAIIDASYDCEYGWWVEGLMKPPNALEPSPETPLPNPLLLPSVGVSQVQRAARPRRASP